MPVAIFGGGGLGPAIPTIHLWSALGDYEAVIAEGSHNFNFPAIDFDSDSMLVLVIDLGASAALNLLMRINSVATGSYFTDGRKIAAGVETLVDLNAQTSALLASSTILSGATSTAFIKALIGTSKITANNPTMIISQGAGSGSNEQLNSNGPVVVSITDITVLTSASTWKIGTRMTLYRVQRVGYQNTPI